MDNWSLSSPELLTTREERAEARRVVKSWDREEQEAASVKARNERLEVKELLRAVTRPAYFPEERLYREQKLNRLWELAFA